MMVWRKMWCRDDGVEENVMEGWFWGGKSDGGITLRRKSDGDEDAAKEDMWLRDDAEEDMWWRNDYEEENVMKGWRCGWKCDWGMIPRRKKWWRDEAVEEKWWRDDAAEEGGLERWLWGKKVMKGWWCAGKSDEGMMLRRKKWWRDNAGEWEQIEGRRCTLQPQLPCTQHKPHTELAPSLFPSLYLFFLLSPSFLLSALHILSLCNMSCSIFLTVSLSCISITPDTSVSFCLTLSQTLCLIVLLLCYCVTYSPVHTQC